MKNIMINNTIIEADNMVRLLAVGDIPPQTKNGRPPFDGAADIYSLKNLQFELPAKSRRIQR